MKPIKGIPGKPRHINNKINFSLYFSPSYLKR